MRIQPLHPPTVHLPIGLLIGGWIAVVADAGSWLDHADVVARFAIVAGLIAAAPAATTGFIELVRASSTISNDAELTLWWHLGLMLTAVSVYGAALWAHVAGPAWMAVTLSTIGTAVLTVGGHVGGNLVYRHRIGPVARDPEVQSRDTV